MASHRVSPSPSRFAAPLLATKLNLPVLRSASVARPRLLARLEVGLRGRLTLIAAPPGFGKSTLLAQTIATLRPSDDGTLTTGQLASPCVGWVALDERDNDPARFWSYVCAGLDRGNPGLGEPALALLRADPMATEAAVAELLNTLAEAPSDVVLVLDDYHVIAAQEIHRGVGLLLEHAPPGFHLVLASRTDPPLPLARWRARGELVELRAQDLRFSPEEALQFLDETMGLDLDAEVAAALEARTEGWAAGLQLAALSLQGEADVQSFITGFSGSHRHVVDYLAEEVLGRQPEHVRAFLLQTSILERFCGPLCDSVLGLSSGVAGSDSYSRHVLDSLERDNLFLIPLDGERRWYRYHHLFADLLRHRLGQEHPALVAELHRRAASWFAQNGSADEALGHALAAGDTDLLARLLTAHGSRFVASGEAKALQRWLDALPHEVLFANPRLCLTQVSVLILHRNTVAVEPYLAAVEAALAGDGLAVTSMRGELLTLRAHLAIERGNHVDALRLAREAAALLPPDEHRVRSSNGLVLGYTLMLVGRTDEAVAAYAENVQRCRTAGDAVSGIFSANELIKLRLLQGRLREAHAAAEEALTWVRAAGWQHLPPTSALHIWLGNVQIERGDLEAASRELATAHRLTQAGITTARAHTFLARLALLRGDAQEADAALRSVEALCRDWAPGGERVFFDAYVARLRLLLGDHEAARRWAAGRTPWATGEAPGYFREIELLSLARVAILAGEGALDDTLAMLGDLRAQARAAGRGAIALETIALEALVYRRRGDLPAALSHLDEALALAAPEGFVGLFADLGSELGELLAQSLARRPATDALRPYLTRVLGAVPGARAIGAPEAPTVPVAPAATAVATSGGSVPEVEALTEREREVLQLFAAGMTSAEIAQHFVVSVNTVKTQLKSIYAKLAIHTRAELVARARALKLIP